MRPSTMFSAAAPSASTVIFSGRSESRLRAPVAGDGSLSGSATTNRAAPTAGLHLTPELLDALRARGVEIASVTLHVGIGTFKPVKVDLVEEHRMDPERGVIPEETSAAIRRAKEEGRRVVAVGTTSVRTLEASAREHGGMVAAGPFETRLFLVPGAEFRVVDALLTNFHLPRSTLLMLVSAFAGRDQVLAAYREAVRSGYRFFSYGDAMLVG